MERKGELYITFNLNILREIESLFEEWIRMCINIFADTHSSMDDELLFFGSGIHMWQQYKRASS